MQRKKKFSDFKAVARNDWEVAAREELDGTDPWEKLVHQGDGWSIGPYYDHSGGKQEAPLLQDSKNIFLGPRAWYNCPCIRVQKASDGNKKALESLQQGADGILFELEAETDFEILLNEIQWEYCSLNFLVKKKSEAVADALSGFISRKKKSGSNLHGAFFGNVHRPGLSHPPFRFSGVHIEPSESPVEELVSSFRALSRIFKDDLPNLGSNAALILPIGQDFFLEVAKLRAARVLWEKFLAKTGSGHRPLYLHAHSLPEHGADFQPHGNMLRSASSAIAAVLGGCDALTLLPEDPDQSMMSRVATNVSSILREESHLSKVADPVAGSWFIEDLTGQLTNAAWEAIQRDLS